MNAETIRNAGLKGWRGKVADAVATPVANRSSASKDQVRTVVGLFFLVLTLVSLARTVRRLVDEDR